MGPLAVMASDTLTIGWLTIDPRDVFFAVSGIAFLGLTVIPRIRAVPFIAAPPLYLLAGALLALSPLALPLPDPLAGGLALSVVEHYADTGGFTDHVFAACAMLGYRFAPRIRDLPDKRLYAFEPNGAPVPLRPLIAARIRTDLIERNWSDLLRLTASMALGTVRPSAILRKLAAYPRQNELALALREVGRVERSLFLLRWITDAALQRHAQLGINKGEAHHALKRAIALGRRGEIRDRSAEGQHHRMAGLNLVAAAIIHWNTRQLGQVVAKRATSDNVPDPTLLPHVSPLGWEHIHLTGEYRWPS